MNIMRLERGTSLCICVATCCVLLNGGCKKTAAGVGKPGTSLTITNVDMLEGIPTDAEWLLLECKGRECTLIARTTGGAASTITTFDIALAKTELLGVMNNQFASQKIVVWMERNDELERITSDMPGDSNGRLFIKIVDSLPRIVGASKR